MASIYQRQNKDDTKAWRAVIRIKGHPSVSDHFERKREAEDWAAETERQIRQGKYTRSMGSSRHWLRFVTSAAEGGIVVYQRGLLQV